MIKADQQKFNNDPRNQSFDPSKVVQFYVNGGLVRAEGVDVDLSWTPNRTFQALLNGEYEFTAKTISDPSFDPATSDPLQVFRTFHQRPIKTPVWRGNLVGKYNFTDGPLNHLSIGGAVRYSDGYWASEYYLQNMRVPAETLVDLFANYSTRLFGTPTDVHLTLLNVTNRVNDMTRGNGLEAKLSLGFTF